MPRQQHAVEYPYESFEVLDLSRGKHSRDLTRLIVSDAEFSFASVALLDLIQAAGCRSVVVEHDYIDRDHERSFTRFYSRAFQDTSKRTRRLHFFGNRLFKTRLDEQLSDPDVAKSYRGFCVLRPLQARRIGRTVVPPPKAAGIPGTPTHFPLSASAFDVNLAGRRFAAFGAPFMEQDARVAACATSALWMSTEGMSRRFGLPTFTTAEITEFATRYYVGGRPIPSPGLTTEQMVEALRTMGYDPLVVKIIDQAGAVETIYPYVESGISPILLMTFITGLHTETVVGHTFDVNRAPRKRVNVKWRGKSIRFWRSWQWVDGFLVHDDQRGLYRKLTFVDRDEAKQAIRARYPTGTFDKAIDQWRCPVRIDMSTSQLGHRADYAELWGVMVPLPPGVSLSSSEAERKVARIVQAWHEMREKTISPDLYLRTYLTRSADFKARMGDNEDLHGLVRTFYRSKRSPRWIWVTEVGYRRDLIRSDLESQRIRGEIVLDANGSPWTPDFVSLHMPMSGNFGYLTTMRSHETKYEDVERALRNYWECYPDVAYHPLFR